MSLIRQYSILPWQLTGMGTHDHHPLIFDFFYEKKFSE
tara:strand:- start:384 stop:497 length:114 start_codon:yes stop_codon:yes gene_type:complete